LEHLEGLQLLVRVSYFLHSLVFIVFTRRRVLPAALHLLINIFEVIFKLLGRRSITSVAVLEVAKILSEVQNWRLEKHRRVRVREGILSWCQVAGASHELLLVIVDTHVWLLEDGLFSWEALMLVVQVVARMHPLRGELGSHEQVLLIHDIDLRRGVWRVLI